MRQQLGQLGVAALAIAAAWGCGGSEVSGPFSADTSVAADTSTADTAVADSGTSDADTSPDDTSLMDSSGEDTTPADTALPDTTPADTALPDTSVADSSVSDTNATDTIPADVVEDTTGDDASDASSDTAEVTEDAALDTTDAGPPPCTTPADCAAFPVGPCEEAACDTDQGVCAARPAFEGDACEDGNLCTAGEVCVAGACVPTKPVLCQDDNPCTDDTCEPAVGCRFRNNFAACDNADPCTIADHCAGGVCTAGAPACDDHNPCTADSCTADGTCGNLPDDAQACDDGSDCTLGDHCSGGACLAGTGDGCADDNPCTDTACAADGLACLVTPLDDVPCSDLDACTDGDSCDDGVCDPGPAIDCGGHPHCIEWTCDPVSGCDLVEIFGGETCNDFNKCTEGDLCDDAGDCVAASTKDCDDGNPCTLDTCHPSQGCRHSVSTGPCEDGNACTFDDRCVVGQCRGTPRTCDDGDACTLDTCDPLIGCQFVPDGITCDDDNDCTTDRCDPLLGCVFESTLAACDDGAVCTVDDRCQEDGSCAGVTATCEDDDPCTADVCDAEEGCFNFDFTGPCDDGDACTAGELCEADALCDGGDPVDPDDGVSCTVDACAPDIGVSNTPDHAVCAVGEACDLAAGCAAVTPVVVITRLMLDPGASGTEPGFGQWLVLRNLTDAVLDLTGWTLQVGDATAPLVADSAGDLLLAGRGALAAGKLTADAPPQGALALGFGAAADGFAFPTDGALIELRDAAGAVVDAFDTTALTTGPAIGATELPLLPGVPLTLDAVRLDGADAASVNDDPAGWCLLPLAPTDPAAACGHARLNEVRLGGPDGDRWVELFLPQGGSVDGLIVRFVGPDGLGINALSPTGRMPIGEAFLLREGVDGAPMPTLASGSVQLVRAGALLDVYGFGTLTAAVDNILEQPLVEGAPGPEQGADDVAWRTGDGVDSDDNAADWTVGPAGSPGALNAP